jgi:hypothetical protein
MLLEVDMTILNIFALVNGGAGSATKAALADVGKNVGKAPSDSASGAFKRVKAAATPAPASVGQTKGGANKSDNVRVSNLAQGLTGSAAELFGHLDNKARGALEGLVKSGQVSVDDAVRGLRYYADETSFYKAVEKLPGTDAEKALGEKIRGLQAAQEAKAKGPELAAATKELEQAQEEYSKALDAGVTDLKGVSDRLEAAGKAHSALFKEVFDISQRGIALRGQITLGFTRRFQIVAEAKAASGHPDGGVVNNPQDKKAADKLEKLGFGARELRNALLSYGAAVSAKADRA